MTYQKEMDQIRQQLQEHSHQMKYYEKVIFFLLIITGALLGAVCATVPKVMAMDDYLQEKPLEESYQESQTQPVE